MNAPPVSNYPRPHLEAPQGPKCPQCGSEASTKVSYTWWGGVLGPRMMNLVKCAQCRCQFNSKTGQSARNAILIYNVVAILLMGVIVFVMTSR